MVRGEKEERVGGCRIELPNKSSKPPLVLSWKRRRSEENNFTGCQGSPSVVGNGCSHHPPDGFFNG